MNTKGITIVSIALGLFSFAATAPTAQAQMENIPDTRIANAIEDELLDARNVNENQIRLAVSDGVATLSGTVSNILQKDRAARIARMVKGVTSVVNNLKVMETDRSDSDVRTDVIAAIAADPATESWEIGVSVDDGTVSLGGTVESYAEKQLAATVAKGVRGVRGISNNIAIEYVADRSDVEIENDISQRLKWDVRIDDALVDVDVIDGRVELTGTVGSAYERSLAIADAWVMGTETVEADDLEVEWWARSDMERPGFAASLSDGEIREAVNDALMVDPRVFSFNPNVSVNDGVVTLTGEVDDLKAKRAAAQTASNTVGVDRVKNYLKIEPAGDIADDTIEEDVESALLRDPIVTRHEITIDVIDGVAHLYGEVDSYYERAQAEDVAVTTIGVTDVENHLDVDYNVTTYETYYDWDPITYDYDYDYEVVSTKPDAEIKDEIESELFWSPFVDSDEVTVTVEDGVATLTGTAEDWSEFDAATENAIEGGAVRVRNRMDVKTDK